MFFKADGVDGRGSLGDGVRTPSLSSREERKFRSGCCLPKDAAGDEAAGVGLTLRLRPSRIALPRSAPISPLIGRRAAVHLRALGACVSARRGVDKGR